MSPLPAPRAPRAPTPKLVTGPRASPTSAVSGSRRARHPGPERPGLGAGAAHWPQKGNLPESPRARLADPATLRQDRPLPCDLCPWQAAPLSAPLAPHARASVLRRGGNVLETASLAGDRESSPDVRGCLCGDRGKAQGDLSPVQPLSTRTLPPPSGHLPPTHAPRAGPSSREHPTSPAGGAARLGRPLSPDPALGHQPLPTAPLCPE